MYVTLTMLNLFLFSKFQVEGYVLLVGIYTDNLYLDNLRLIRGTTLFKNKYSLYVSLVFRKGTTFGIEHLGFRSLQGRNIIFVFGIKFTLYPKFAIIKLCLQLKILVLWPRQFFTEIKPCLSSYIYIFRNIQWKRSSSE